MSYPAIAKLLARHIGLDAASLGDAPFRAAVGERLRALNLRGEAVYADLLGKNENLLRDLVEAVIVRETWFFRAGELFRHLAATVPGMLQSRPAGRPFRALSLPCSTGEEPYSLAMTLLDAGCAEQRFRIDGMDISPACIDAARRGVYRASSFRGTPPEARDRHFAPVDGDWEIGDAVRRTVAFEVGNILDPELARVHAAAFDLVLCRNLLIYLTPEARRLALAHLEAMLAPEGWLAVGHAEAGIIAGRDFHRLGPEGTFLFGRGHDASRQAHEPAPPKVAPASRRTRAAAPDLPTAPTPPAAPAVAAKEPKPPSPLQDARRLADANRLDEAYDQCLRQLEVHGPSADAFALLALVQQTRGQVEEAAEAIRKALYLDPRHREALTQAMLLSAQRGETARAALLRQRLARADQGDAP